MLMEFHDTAIDFTETEDDSGDTGEGVDEMSAPVVKLVQLMINEAVYCLYHGVGSAEAIDTGATRNLLARLAEMSNA